MFWELDAFPHGGDVVFRNGNTGSVGEVVENDIPTSFNGASTVIGARDPYKVSFGIFCISEKTSWFAARGEF